MREPTGIKDKHGVEIIEGDRLRGDNSVNYKVCLTNGVFMGDVTGYFDEDTHFREESYPLKDFEMSSIEIIGSVHT